jgi:hypothetical protein
MDSLFSFPVGLFIPYNTPVYPDALRMRRDLEFIHHSFLLC